MANLDWSAIVSLSGLLAIVLGYLSGSVPYGLLLTRWAGFGDVRAIGSGNIGATNVLRTGNKKIAALTLVLDVVKATIPTLIFAGYFGEAVGLVAGFAAFLGHLFPVWLGFKGGKGVATAIGLLFGLYWLLGTIFVVIWVAVAFAFRRSSVASLSASVLAPVAGYLTGRAQLVLPLVVLAIIIWFTHRENIARLLRGEEPKIRLGRRA